MGKLCNNSWVLYLRKKLEVYIGGGEDRGSVLEYRTLEGPVNRWVHVSLHMEDSEQALFMYVCISLSTLTGHYNSLLTLDSPHTLICGSLHDAGSIRPTHMAGFKADFKYWCIYAFIGVVGNVLRIAKLCKALTLVTWVIRYSVAGNHSVSICF